MDSRFAPMAGTAALILLVGFLAAFVVTVLAFTAGQGGAGGVAYGSDFAMFVSGSRALQRDRNPYDARVLYATERDLLSHQHIPVSGDVALVRVGNPPFFLWALKPMAGWPFRLAAGVWTAVTLSLTIVGFIAVLSYLGWRRRVAPLMVFLLLPQAFFGVYYGNVSPVVFASLSIGLLLANRYPVAAGAIFAVAWIKPQIALPLLVVIAMFHLPRLRATAAGFICATAALFALTAATSGLASLGWWLRALVGYENTRAGQKDLASLAGLYVRWAPRPVVIILGIGTLAFVLCLSMLTRRRLKHVPPVDVRYVGWLWCLWFLATPYAHINDAVVLAVPVLTLIGRDGRAINRNVPALCAIYALASCLAFNDILGSTVNIQCLKLLLLTGCVYWGLRGSRSLPHGAENGENRQSLAVHRDLSRV